MTSLTDLRAVLDDLEKRASDSAAAEKRLKSFEGLLGEIGSALADIVEHMEKPAAVTQAAEPPDFEPIVKAIKGLKLTAPAVNVNPVINVPKQDAPVVNVTPTLRAESWKELHIQMNREQYGNRQVESLTITKIK